MENCGGAGLQLGDDAMTDRSNSNSCNNNIPPYTITTQALPSSVCQSFFCMSVRNSVVLPTTVNSVAHL